MAPKLAALFLSAAIAFAAENAVLTSGFSVRVDRHEGRGSEVRLYLNGGSMDVPAGSVVRFEAEPTPAKAPESVRTQQPQPAPRELVTQAAKLWDGLPPALLHAIARAESGYRTGAVSPKGAIGLMQLMPSTARQLGVDPADAKQNAEGGAKYLVELLWRYRSDPYQVRKAVAAYNAGPAAVDRYNGIPPYRETIQYVERVIRQWRQKEPAVSADRRGIQ